MPRNATPFLLLLLIGSLNTLWAQDTWTLERAVRYALDNNLQVQQAGYGVRSAELDLRQDQFSRLPNINGSVSAGIQFGRTIDPTTNTFDNERIGFNSYNISVGAPLFQGGFINKSIQQSTLNLEAARLDVEDTERSVALLVASSYLNVLLASEQLNNANYRLALSREQLQQTQRLIRAGSLPVNDSLELIAQIAQDEQTLIEIQNQIDINTLQLKQLLQLDAAAPFQIAQPDVEVGEEAFIRNYTLEEVYRVAINNQPNVRAGELRVESARLGEELARTAFYPTLNVFGSLSTNYSSIAKDFTNPDQTNVELVLSDPVPVVIDGRDATLSTFDLNGLVFPNLPYFDQLERNFGQSVGLSLQVPIFTQGRNRFNVQRAQLATLNNQVQFEQIRQQLRTDIQQAIASYRAGRESYLAAGRAVRAAEAAFQNMQRRYDLGAANTLELTTAANRLDQARTELTRAKYQLLFNQKVVQFYLGEEIKL